MDADLGKNLRAGDRHYRAFVGPPDRYDLMAASQFALLANLGLREDHHLLDLGCGSLRAGRLFMAYLLPGRYCGLEPEQWLVEEGLEREVGRDILRVKQPTFLHNRNFELSGFGRSFDFVLAQSVFSHASEELLRGCLREVRRVLKPSGVLAANFKTGPIASTAVGWVYPKCVTYPWSDLHRIIADEGFACVRLSWPHPSLSWTAIVHAGQQGRVCDIGRAGTGLSFVGYKGRASRRPDGRSLFRRAWHSFARMLGRKSVD
jgi:SAM-dependent methyltransferase